MKVYIVFESTSIPYSADEVHVEKIFLNEEKANEYANECNKNNIWSSVNFYADEYEVEE